MGKLIQDIKTLSVQKPTITQAWFGNASGDEIQMLVCCMKRVLNLGALSNLVIEEHISKKDESDKNILENDIESAKAA